MEGLVLAGGVADESLQQLGVQRVPLLTVGGETLAARTCRLLVEAGCDPVYLLAPDDVPLPGGTGVSAGGPVLRSAHSGDLMADLTACVKSMQDEGLIVATGDAPLLSHACLQELVDFVRQTGAQAVYPVVEKAVMEQRGLDKGRTYKKVGGRSYTGGNVFYLDRLWLLTQENLLRGLIEQRKDPMALAKFFGAGFVWKVVSGSLTLPYAEEYLSKRLGARIKVLVTQHAEVAADLDKAEDLAAFAGVLDAGQFPA
jgi:GTP:adenosylcobinamide-phosphate guanylyltransferase